MVYLLAGLWVKENNNWSSGKDVMWVSLFTPGKVLSCLSPDLLLSPTSPDLPESGPKSLGRFYLWVI